MVLHQVADDRGSAPMLYKNTVAHFVVARTGTIIRLHPSDAYLNASNTFNKVGVAVEFGGHFPAEDGKWW